MYKHIILGVLIAILACACTQATAFPLPTNTPSNIMWEEFPIMPGGVEIKDNTAAYHYTINSNIETVTKFYREQMKNTKREFLGGIDQSGMDMKAAVLWFVSGERIVSIQIAVKDSLTHVFFIISATHPTPFP